MNADCPIALLIDVSSIILHHVYTEFDGPGNCLQALDGFR